MARLTEQRIREIVKEEILANMEPLTVHSGQLRCGHCTRLFHPYRPKQRFCNTSCRVMAWRKRKLNNES